MKIVKYAAAGSLAGAAFAPSGAALAAWELNMPVGVTELSRDIHGLHMLIFWICVLIAIAVFGMMIYSIVKFRHSQGAVPANFDHSTKAEIVWTIIPVAILVGMAIPAAATLVKIEDTRDSDMTVKVTGYQWKWQYEYLDQDVSFFSTLARDSDHARQLDSGVDPNSVENYLLEVDNPLVVPVGKKVRVLLTSHDVIHAWWVPAFGMKKDAIPGFVNELWFRADEPGIYRGQCAELCGRDHAFMPVVVNVLPQQEYDSWLAQQKGGEQAAPAAASAQTVENAAPATAAAAE
ncbi:cytochrome c oxidase subunit II [Steroidobacter sp. S1-65]|uniref:Cytochrome c oxidase subunit 2 n=1 Tax=Steroidobacter gossypii TaxID=2805490 RepID=A0ABS1WT72_9GAMM|nr:cytochrome c oxidase subunit II [Steroidobacter gossypii]MBM0104165.1 cytochrome c oxidase subunit II [Steroidobacter gossypii]